MLFLLSGVRTLMYLPRRLACPVLYGIKRQHEVVKVDVELFGQSFSCEAALVDSDETDYLLMGPSIGSDLYWDLLKARREPNLLVRETRVQSKRRKEEDLRCRQLDELDGTTPHLDKLIVESSHVAEVTETDDSTLSADDEEDPPLSPAVAEGEDECIPLPVLDSHQREELIECTAKDSSLERLKKYADEGSMGYSWEDGVLMNDCEVVNLGYVKRIVVPQKFRSLILDLAHKHSGHLEVAKVRAFLAPFYTWPGVHKDVRAHCSFCSECQIAKRSMPSSIVSTI